MVHRAGRDLRPVLVIIPYDDEDDAVRIANDSQYGSSGFVVSADPAAPVRWRSGCGPGRCGSNGAPARRPEPTRSRAATACSGTVASSASCGSEEYLETKSNLRLLFSRRLRLTLHPPIVGGVRERPSDVAVQPMPARANS
jgi:hypothetical protein